MLNLNEAKAVDLLLRYLLQVPDGRGRAPDAGAGLEAAQYLASRAHSTLDAGLNAGEVIRRWPRGGPLAASREAS